MPTLTTLSRAHPFSYSRDPDGNLTITYGNNHSYTITAPQLAKLLAAFAGQTVPLGTSRDNPPEGSIGHWLNQHVTKAAIATYLGPILLHEHLATRQPNNGKALMLKIL